MFVGLGCNVKWWSGLVGKCHVSPGLSWVAACNTRVLGVVTLATDPFHVCLVVWIRCLRLVCLSHGVLPLIRHFFGCLFSSLFIFFVIIFHACLFFLAVFVYFPLIVSVFLLPSF